MIWPELPEEAARPGGLPGASGVIYYTNGSHIRLVDTHQDALVKPVGICAHHDLPQEDFRYSFYSVQKSRSKELMFACSQSGHFYESRNRYFIFVGSSFSRLNLLFRSDHYIPCIDEFNADNVIVYLRVKNQITGGGGYPIISEICKRNVISSKEEVIYSVKFPKAIASFKMGDDGFVLFIHEYEFINSEFGFVPGNSTLNAYNGITGNSIPILEFKGIVRHIISMSISPDGRILSVLADKLLLFDSSSFELILQSDSLHFSGQHLHLRGCHTWSPSGNMIAFRSTADLEGMYLIDTVTLSEVSLVAPEINISSMTWCSNELP